MAQLEKNVLAEVDMGSITYTKIGLNVNNIIIKREKFYLIRNYDIRTGGLGDLEGSCLFFLGGGGDKFGIVGKK